MIQVIEGKAHQIIKRNGSIELYNHDKMRKVILWACEGSNILADELLQAIDIKIHNKMKIETLFDEVIATASNKISDLYPIWEKVAKNLYELKLHKEMGFLRDDYPSYSYIFDANEEAGLYHTSWREILDLEELSAAIDPSYDKLFTFGGLNVFVDKYCNKSKGKLLELPQHTYMRVAIQLMYKDGTDAIIDKYLQLAKHEVTEATPKMVNSMRWKAALFSCCLNRPSDSQEGINESINMLSKESKYSGGCAWDSSLLRGPGSRVEGNNGSSGGAIPFIQELQWTVGGYNQGNTRSSACINTFDAFHIQSPEIAQLKLESGKDEDRARKLQYSVKWNRYFSKAIKSNADIHLMNPHKTQDLFESFGDKWLELYNKYLKNTSINKRKYNARELAFRYATTTFETGNLYYFFSDNANEQDIGAGYIPASNLCQEMMMSYDPVELVSSELVAGKAVHIYKGDIALCNLASVNLIKWFLLSDIEKERLMYILVKSADNAIENSYYVNPLGERHSKAHRNLGIGTSNYANLLASQKLLWNSEGARKLTHELYEELSYYAIKASIQIAKETSRCEVWKDTKWAKGYFPHELSILGKSDSSLNYPLKKNWNALRFEMYKYGIRNSRIMAIAPTATSGKAINATEGVDAPRKLKTIQEGTYSLPFVVPNLRENREYYQTTFEIDNKDTIELAAIRQKFLCMSQSVSLGFNSSKSAYDLVSALIYAEELGLKTIYYTHTRKAEDVDVEVCESCGS